MAPFTRPTCPLRTPAGGRTDGTATRWPAVAWLAATGVSLVLIAALVFAVTNWSVIPNGVKLAALIALNVSVILLAERITATLPTVGRALLHLGALLVGVTVASCAIAFAARWPDVLLLSGAAAVTATSWIGTLRRAPLLLHAIPLSMVLALAGAAGRTGVPLGVLVAGAALAGVLGGQQHHGARLAAIAAFGPLAAGLGGLPVGAGTVARLGLTGDALAWAAPTAGVLAGTALAIVAQRRHSVLHAVAMYLAVTGGILIGLGHADLTAPVWAVAAALCAIAVVGAATAMARHEFWAAVLEPVTATVEAGLALAALPAAVVVSSGGSAMRWRAVDWALALLVSGGAAVLAALRPTASETADRSVRRSLFATVAVVLTMAAAMLATGSAAAGAAVGLAGVVLAIATRRHPAGSAVGAVLCVVPVLAGPLHGTAGSPVALSAVSCLAAGLALVAGRADRARSDLVGLLGAVALLPCAAAVAASFQGAVTVLGATVLAVTVELLRLRRPLAGWVWAGTLATLMLAAAAAAARLSPGGGRSDQATVGAWWITIAWWATLGLWMVFALRFATRAQPAEPEGWRGHLGAVAVGTGIMLSTVAVDGPIRAVVWMLIAAGSVGYAMAFARSRATVLATLAGGCDAGAALGGFILRDALAVGWVVMLAGTVMALHGWARRALPLAGMGAFWFASGASVVVHQLGLVPWILDRLGPAGVTGTDLGMMITSAVLGVGGLIVSRLRPGSSSWSTVAPGFALAAGWLAISLGARGDSWRVFVGLGVGVAAVAVGGWRRLAAPLVLGTALTASMIVLGARNGLATLPVWSWLAFGGAALLGLAVLLERKAGAVRHDGRSLLESVLGDYR